MGSIGDVFVEQTMVEHLVGRINVRYVKFKAMESKTTYYVIMPELVSQKFHIGINKMKDMLGVTTHKGIMHAVHPLYCRYRVDNVQLNRKRLNAQFYTDHLLSKTKSLKGKIGAWIYTTKCFTVAYPCTKRSEVGDALRQFADNVGILEILKSDLAPEITEKYTEFKAQVNRLFIDLAHSVIGRSNQNHAAEGDIGHLKKSFPKNMVSNKVPKHLWGYGLVHQAGILSRIVRGKIERAAIGGFAGQMPEVS